MPSKLNDKVIQLIRTAVPGFVGVVLASLGHFLLSHFQWNVDLAGYDAVVAPVIVTVCIAGYLSAVQWLEKHFSTNGIVRWLRGHPAVIAYLKPGEVILQTNGIQLATPRSVQPTYVSPTAAANVGLLPLATPAPVQTPTQAVLSNVEPPQQPPATP